MKNATKKIAFVFALGFSLAFSLACEKSKGDRVFQWDVRRYPSGALLWKRSYVQGVKDGVHEGWWENGRKKFEYHFTLGEYDGDVREWYPDGSPALHLQYKNGRESGLQRAWRENGTLYANYEAREGKNFGVINARLCYSIKDGAGVFHAAR